MHGVNCEIKLKISLENNVETSNMKKPMRLIPKRFCFITSLLPFCADYYIRLLTLISCNKRLINSDDRLRRIASLLGLY